MPDTPKLSFFQRPEFNYWLITSFFTIVVVFCLVFLPALGARRLGAAVDEELSRYEIPVERWIETPEAPPVGDSMKGIPVAMSPSRTEP